MFLSLLMRSMESLMWCLILHVSGVRMRASFFVSTAVMELRLLLQGVAEDLVCGFWAVQRAGGVSGGGVELAVKLIRDVVSYGLEGEFQVARILLWGPPGA